MQQVTTSQGGRLLLMYQRNHTTSALVLGSPYSLISTSQVGRASSQLPSERLATGSTMPLLLLSWLLLLRAPWAAEA